MKWNKHNETKKIEIYGSNWICPDGDNVNLYIYRDESGLQLNCFSGIPGSNIYINEIDFNRFDIDFNKSFKEQCFDISDYLCSLLCEKVDF